MSSSSDMDETSCLLPQADRKAVDPLSLTRSQRWSILAGVWLAQCISVRIYRSTKLTSSGRHWLMTAQSLNTTLIATLMASISSEFGSSNQASLLATSYLLATSTFTPLYGRLSNVLGRRGANQLAIFLTASGTLGSGMSKNMTSLIVWRFVSVLVASLV